ncbi:uncharacterized protein CPUR_06339 [Claviceps purpurea 20.1]|uniref:YMC020W-like alpha/beta hydrolase domain-containing protein n=1 Tax=Claviceps purpurea (strain 20.1) TaxID=1111077 RepID=M1WH99_CLAP2|nr:hypothetical protein E4U50_008040 [Claviceps purpurea]CCE32479.1 uncharacterized protein CPUR_06339 [Claviceps purpurea 20.1]
MPSTAPGNPPATAIPDSTAQKQVRRTKSWYGQWPNTPRKASASTSVARENILGGTVRSSAAPDLGRYDSLRLKSAEAASLRSSSRSVSLAEDSQDGSVRRGVTTPDGVVGDVPYGKRGKQKRTTKSTDPAEGLQNTDETTAESAPQDPTTESNSTLPLQQRPTSSASWLGWWSKAPPPTDQQKDTTVVEPEDAAEQTVDDRPVTPPAEVAPDAVPRESPSARPASSTWFGWWSSTDAKMEETDGANVNTKEADVEKQDKPETDKHKQSEHAALQDVPEEAISTSKASEQATTPKAGSTWVFWARAAPSSASTKDSSRESGEMAVMGEGSEAQPTRMREGDVSGPQTKDLKPNHSSSKATQLQRAQLQDVQPETKSSWRKKKRARPPSLDAIGDSDVSTNAASSTTTHEPQGLPPPPTRVRKLDAPPAKAESWNNSTAELETGSVSKHPPNLLLPSFSSTYQMKENPSILQQITQLLLRTSQPPANHVFRANRPPQVRKAIAIGVHGLFPATYLRPMIGQPTGTSLRFANLCAEAIRRWTDAHGSPDCEIEKVALEGEGRISDRVDNLWKLMLNWIDHIRNADLIIMACHSQGVPVSIMLLEKLIDLGIITDAKIGVCAMAGVSMGPFPDYKSSLFMGSAAELWEFGNPQSANSQRFETSLKRVLDYGARVTFIGSIDDQVVPMESAVYSPASHPYIYRAVFIDGRIHAPDFIAHLVGFALKLRNLGVKDHGLVRELSVALAGSLYSGEGHSRLYYDPAVYDLAICHALETTSTPSPVSCEVARREGLSSTNPYVLPWIMRGMLEEDFVKTELSSETDELLRQFDAWKPSSKALKDVKYRLEAVRSKL